MKWNDVIRYANHGSPVPPRRVEKTESEWEGILSPETFYVTRQKGTERAHSNEMCTFFEPGIYACACCDTELFDSSAKFESGSGWPSFTQPLYENHVGYHKDTTFGMIRVEATCNVCDAHLGHVFPDGPAPSGLRFCTNSASLKKIKE